MKKLVLTSVLVAMFSMPAFALDLHGARTSGKVGEKTDGYVSALVSTPDVQALVAEVNAKRKAEYTRISSENGQPVDVVAKLAASQIISGLEAGSSYQDASGAWKKR
jgi:uncharacterized protein